MKRKMALLLALSMMLGMIQPACVANAAEIPEDAVIQAEETVHAVWEQESEETAKEETAAGTEAVLEPEETDAEDLLSESPETEETVQNPEESREEETAGEPEQPKDEDPAVSEEESSVNPEEADEENPEPGSSETEERQEEEPASETDGFIEELLLEEVMEEEPPAAAEETENSGETEEIFTIEDGVLTGYSGEGGEVTIPEDVTSIGEKVFYENTAVTKVIVPKSVTSIGTSAFEGSGVTEVKLQEGILEIGENAFRNCQSLEELVLPDTVESLDDYVFYGSGLKRLVLGKNLSSVGYEGLGGMKSLEELTVPNRTVTKEKYYLSGTNPKILRVRSSAESITEDFLNFSNLTEILAEEDTVSGTVNYETDGEALYRNLEDGSKELVRYPQSRAAGEEASYTALPRTASVHQKAFYGTASLKSVTLPEGVTSVGASAFEDSGVTEVKLQEGILEIGENAFRNCQSLEELVLPDTVESLDDYVFYGSGLKRLVLGKNLSSVGHEGLGGMKSLEELTVPNRTVTKEKYYLSGTNPKILRVRSSAESITEDFLNFSNLTEILAEEDTVSGTVNYETDGEALYRNLEDGSKELVRYPQSRAAGEEASYTALPGTASVHQKAFYGTASLKSVTLPEGVTSVGASAFEDSGVTEVKLQEGILEIGENAFRNCQSLEELVLPDTVESLDDYVFYGSGLKKLVLGKNLSSVGYEGLGGMKSLEELTVPNQAVTKEKYYLSGTNPKILRVRSSAESITEDFLNFSNLTEILTEEDPSADTANYISDQGILFRNLGSGQALVRYPIGRTEADYDLPDTVTVIGPGAFYNQTALAAVRVPRSVTSIETDAFKGCTNLTIYCYSGTEMQSYAETNGLKYELIDEHTHEFSDWIVTKKENCTADGSAYRRCNTCYFREYQTIPAWGHDMSPVWFNDKEATCTGKGFQSHHCMNEGCTYRTDERTVDALGHQFTDWTVRTEATEMNAGEQFRTCVRCGLEEKEVIPRIPVDWSATKEFGLVKIRLLDEEKNPIANGKAVFFNLEGESYSSVSDETGMIERILKTGEYKVYAYRNNTILRSVTIQVAPGVNELPDMYLYERPAMSGSLTHHRMTLDEIKAAGIDLTDGSNYNIYKFTIKIGFHEELGISELPFYMADFGGGNWGPVGPSGGIEPPGNEEAEVTYHSGNGSEDEQWWLKYLNYSDDSGWSRHPYYTIRTEEDTYQVILIDEKLFVVIKGETKWLKEMFDVELFLSNDTNEDMIDCEAKLSVPNGLSLAAMIDDSANQAEQELGTIGPGETKSAHWYVRGDEAGAYSLSAEVDGKMAGYNDPFHYEFSTAVPLIVYAGSALKMTVYVQKQTAYKEPFRVGVQITNVSNMELYNVSHRIFEVSQEVRQTWSHQKVEDGKAEDWTEQTWATVCREAVGEEGCIMADVLNPGESLVVWTEQTIQFEGQMQRELKKNLELTKNLLGVISKHVSSTHEAVTSAICDMFSTIDVRYVVDSIEVTADPGSTTTIPYEIKYIGGGSRKISLREKFGDDFVRRVIDAAYDDAEDEVGDIILDLIPGGEVISTIKNCGDFAEMWVSTDQALHQAEENSSVEVNPSEEGANVRVWTERYSRSRSAGLGGDLVDIQVSGNDTAVKNADGSLSFTGVADLNFTGKAEGDVIIYMQDLSMGTEQTADNTAAVLLHVTKEPEAYTDEAKEYCYYQPGTQITDDYINDLGGFGIRAADRDGVPVSAGRTIRTGDRFQIVKNGEVTSQLMAVVPGDLNGDGLVDLSDVQSLTAHLNGSAELTGAYRQAAELNTEGSVTEADLDKLTEIIMNESGDITDDGSTEGWKPVLRMSAEPDYLQAGKATTVTIALDNYGDASAGLRNIQVNVTGLSEELFRVSDVKALIPQENADVVKTEYVKEEGNIRTLFCSAETFPAGTKELLQFTLTPVSGLTEEQLASAELEIKYRAVTADGIRSGTAAGTFGRPEEPVKPEEPEKPVNPVTPTEPEKPVNPVTPTEPSKPTTPAVPDNRPKSLAAPGISIVCRDKTYTGKSITPSLTITDGGKTLKKGTDYTYKCSNNKNIGKASVTITGKGNYTGKAVTTFTIKPKATSISRLTGQSKKIAVKWKKQTSQTTGYQIQYSTSSKFTKSTTKTVNITKNKTTSKTLSKLKAKKKYYVRIRTYKSVKIKGKTTKIYSDWSKVKNVKTKK